MPEMAEDVEMFRGSSCELSNLYKCPEGCIIEDQGTTFETSEHHYQFKKLHFHDKAVEAYKMLMQEDSYKAMCMAKTLVPPEESEAWKATMKEEILHSNRLKYGSCSHTKEKLLVSRFHLVEATGDHFWGTGLNVILTRECLSDYWPGQNVMGTLLMEI